MSEEIEEETLGGNECPVCHGQLETKDGSPWCPNCDLKFIE